jgi:photosystem II stability/assembly factor-like uncharacterized protein
MAMPARRNKSPVSDEGARPGPYNENRPIVGFTTHKVRSGWFQAREAWPLRESPVELLIRERTRAALEVPPAPGAQQWEPVGPSNIGGRMTSAVCHPTEPERLWAGAAGGGVWFSPDGGRSWQSLWHSQPTLNIGALAIDPQNPNLIYCGTGEANLSADSHAGVGLYRTVDSGSTWQLLAPADIAGLPRRIGTVAVDPFDANHLLVGGVGPMGEPTGLYRSADGGASWARVPLAGSNGYRCHEIRFDPSQVGRIYVTIAALGILSGIWRSTDGATTWQQLSGGLPPPDRIQRSSLALAPSDPDVLYAQLENSRAVLAVVRSGDGGDTWQSISGSHFAAERQMSYNNTIVVHPQDPQHVLCAGVDLHRSRDGGRTWEVVTHWDVERGTPTYAHADHHALVMPPASPGLIYDLNDGGLDVSEDGGTTWQNRSNGLGTNMFYDLAVAQTDGRMIAGGAQDNGTLATLDGTADGYQELVGGDGGWVVIDPANDRHIYGSWQRMNIVRFRASDGWKVVSPPETDFQMWMVFIVMDPGNPRRVFTGSRRVWRTRDDGNTWRAVSGNLDDSDITAIDVARADSQRIYVGTENGGFFRSTDGGDTWSGNLASTVLPGRTITRVESRPDDADTLYATVANFGSRHVFCSRDGGLSWADVDRGVLPDAPFHSVAVPAAHPERLYVGGDAGVFVSSDGGASWANLSGNLPAVMVVDLAFHEQDRTLTAATYGRSIWRIQLD